MKISSLLVPLQILFRGVRALLIAVFGQLGWQPPLWLQGIGRQCRRVISWAGRQPLAATVLLLAMLALAGGGWYGWQWYQHRPVPHTVAVQVEAPVGTDYEKKPMVIAPLRVHFAESVAPLHLVDKPVVSGLLMEPAQPGAWRWADDRTLEFKPQADWPVGDTFTLHFAKKDFFTPGVLLNTYRYTFQTAPFTATIGNGEIYQDPVDSTLKKMVATVDFSHPVDEASLKGAISLTLAKGLAFRDSNTQPWSLALDKNGLHAHIHSAPLAVPLESVAVTLKLAKGVRAARGGPVIEQPIEQAVIVPGRYRLTFSNLETSYVTNQQGEPEQVLMFDSAFPVTDEVIGKHVHAWLLPEKREGWNGFKLTEADLKQAQPLPLSHIAGTEPLNSHHSFRFQAPVKRQMYVKIDARIEAVGGYLSKNPETALLETGEYPKVLKLMGDGALLSLSGEKKVGFMAQGLAGVKVEIARLLPCQLNQLIDQNYGDFARPSVYGDDFDRLVERQAYIRGFGAVNPAKPRYDSVDLSSYLDAQGGRRGVFVLRLTPYDPRQPKREYSDYAKGSENGDRRFVLVTDLGLISKRTLDGGQEVFVQSIAEGTPVAGAKVEILGRNGLPVAEARTDDQGHARFAKMDELRREKTPILLVAELGNDFSFLPLGRSEHRLDFSRFDIGGAANQETPEQVSASLFTDRGLYRPGETAHIGYILRTADWQGRIDGMPIEIEINDPRGTVAWNQRRTLARNGFDALDFTSSASAPTGEYSATIYLVKKNRRNAYLGSTTFKVQEFEPDRMKVELSLAQSPGPGWVRPADIKVRVKARHLFGADASGRRVTGHMRLSPSFPAFKQYPDYRFHVAEVLKESVDENLPEAKTSDQGVAELQPNLQRFGSSTYRLHLTAQVFEAEGGRNVAAEAETLVSGAPFLVGVKTPDPLEYVAKGAVRHTHWLAVGPDLQPAVAEGLSLALIEYRYVSVLVKQNNGTYKYESRRKELLRDNTPLDLPKEGSEITLPTAEPGDFAYELRDAQGAVLNKVSWTVAGAGNLSRSLERNAELQIRLDKPSYAPGDTIRISLRAPFTGAGLITIERDRVYSHVWFKADTTSSVQTIVVPKDLEGNGYVNVQFVRDPASPEVFMSPLSSGVAPFSVSLDARSLPLTLQAPALVKPGQTLTMQVTPGAEARAVVFAIDEGILQAARYKTPDPLGFFFQKRSLDVDTSQILSLILPEFSRLLLAAAPGGGGEEALGAHLNPFKRKHRGPVAYWSGVVDIPASGRTFSYTVPDSFNGRLRLMAVAVTSDRIGVFAGASEVRGPWVLTPNIPAFVAPGDTFTVSTGLFSNLQGNNEVTLSLTTGSGLSVEGESRQQMQVEGQHEGLAEFRLKATEALGSTDLTFVAESSGGGARIRETTSVRPLTPYRVALHSGMFTEKALSLPVQRLLHREYRKVELGVDYSPLVWSRGLTAYLDAYPYGCTEQLLSKAMPALIRATTEGGGHGNLKPVTTAFTILRQRQNEGGGFSQWDGNLQVQPEISVYAADFLIEANMRGVLVPVDLERLSRAYLERISTQGAEGLVELRTRARAVYLLTRKGVVTTGALAATMEQLEQYHHTAWRSDLAAAYLAATHALLKQTRAAEQLIAGVPWRCTAKEQGDQETAVQDIYSDDLGHDAELLTLMARHFPHLLVKIPETLLPALGERLSQDRFHSLSAALLVRAFDLYGRGRAPVGGPITAEVELNATDRQPLVLQGRSSSTALPFTATKVILNKESAGIPAFYLLTEAGFDRQPPTKPLQQGIEIVREYLSIDGKPLTRVKVGEEFKVRLRLRATERDMISEVAIVDLLPGGVEPVLEVPAEPQEELITASAENNEGAGEDSRDIANTPLAWEPTFVDTRDDRVVVYATLRRDAGTYEYRVRATNAGIFQTPPPYAESMYERTLQGRGSSGILTIDKP